MTEQQRIKAINVDLEAFGQHLRAAQPTAHEMAQNLHRAIHQIQPMLPSIASAMQGLKQFEQAAKQKI